MSLVSCTNNVYLNDILPPSPHCHIFFVSFLPLPKPGNLVLAQLDETLCVDASLHFLVQIKEFLRARMH